MKLRSHHLVLSLHDWLGVGEALNLDPKPQTHFLNLKPQTLNLTTPTRSFPATSKPQTNPKPKTSKPKSQKPDLQLQPEKPEIPRPSNLEFHLRGAS